jgi:hypothetical protein
LAGDDGNGEQLSESPALNIKRAVEAMTNALIFQALVQLKKGYEKTGIQEEGLVRIVYDRFAENADISFGQACSIFYYEGSRRFMELQRKSSKKGGK